MRNQITRKLTSICLLVGCIGFLMPWHATGQISTYEPIYRPADAQFRVLQSEHFELIYQEGAFDEAAQTAAILEETLPRTLSLAGLSEDQRLEMPVVLTAYSDQARGLLSPAPFRQEISQTGIRNNIYPAGISTWYNLVAPHELMHAAHAEIDAPIGVGWFMRRVAPDWGRGLNLSIPAGMTEGIAVFRESEIEEGGGRLNQPLFEMQFLAAMDAEDSWSLAQMMERSIYNWPFDRFYKGGSYLFSHLYEQDEGEFFRRSTRFYNRFPFFGYGVAFGVGTGRWPSSIYNDLREATRNRADRSRTPAFSEEQVVAEARGSRFRRPLWEDDSQLITYGVGYSQRPGFYRIDVDGGELEAVSIDDITEDHYAGFSADSSEVYFTRYARDTWSPLRRTADVYAASLSTGQTRTVTDRGRMSAPFERNSELYGFEIDGDRSHLVGIHSAGEVEQLTNLPGALFREAVHDQVTGRTFAVINIEGEQGLFELTEEDANWDLEPMLFFEDGRIHDLSLVPGGAQLVFSADAGGKADIYAYDIDDGAVARLTDVDYGAIEPSVSPDGSRLALVDYQHERYRLVVIPYQPEDGDAVSEDVLMSTEQMNRLLDRASVSRLQAGARFSEEDTTPYRSWEYLRPRAVYPTIYPDDIDQNVGGLATTYLGLGAGLGIEGTDPLLRWVYQAEGFYRANRIWGNLSLRTSRYLLRPSLSVFRRPTTTSATFVDEDGQPVERREIGVDERGGSLSLSLPVTHQDNVFQTTSSYALRGTVRQTRPFERDGDFLADPTLRATIQPAAAFGYRLQRNTRDLHPNSGVVVSGSALADVWTTRGVRSRGAQGRFTLYLPLLSEINGGVRLNAAMLTQNRGVYSTRAFMPRGYRDGVLGPGTHARLDLEITQPLWFIDDGSLLIPFFAEVLYAYGFTQSLFPVEGTDAPRRSSVGAGLGLQFKLFSRIRFDMRVAGVYRPEEGTFGWTWR